MMLEGGKIDWAAHAHDAATVLRKLSTLTNVSAWLMNSTRNIPMKP